MDLTLDKNKRTGKNFLIIVLNSTSYYILAFLFIYLLGQFGNAIAALQYDYTCIIYYYKLVYTIDTYSWTPDAVKLLFSIAPVISLLVGIIMLVVYFLLLENTMKFKMFFLWCFIHGIVWFFGAILAGALLDKGIGYVIMYFYMQDTGKLILSLLSLATLLFIGAFSTRAFFFSANSYFNELTEHNRTFFVFGQVVLPILIGTFIIIGIKLPGLNYYELFVLVTTILLLIPFILKYNFYPTFFFEPFPFRITLDKYGILLAVIALVLFRVIFDVGVPVG